MGAEINDIAVTIIANGKSAYYSSYKGFGNIMWEVDFGLYSDNKPDPFTIFDCAKETMWEDNIEYLKKPLKKPGYGFLIVNFDNKTIIDENGYNSWDCMFLDKFINCVFRFADREMQGWEHNTVLTKKSVIYHLKNENFYIANKNQENSNLVLTKNISDAYDTFEKIGFNDYDKYPSEAREKKYTWAMIKLPKDWTVNNKDSIII